MSLVDSRLRHIREAFGDEAFEVLDAVEVQDLSGFRVFSLVLILRRGRPGLVSVDDDGVLEFSTLSTPRLLHLDESTARSRVLEELRREQAVPMAVLQGPLSSSLVWARDVEVGCTLTPSWSVGVGGLTRYVTQGGRVLNRLRHGVDLSALRREQQASQKQRESRSENTNRSSSARSGDED